MRSLTAILLLGVFLFNLFGYRLLLSYWEQQEQQKLVTKLDQQDYRAEDLVEIKVPIKAAYINNSKEFERVDGEIDFNGRHYQYVMRKVYNDSLVVLCIPHEMKGKIQKAKDSFFSLSADLQQNNSSKKSTESSYSIYKFADYTLQPQQDYQFAAGVVKSRLFHLNLILIHKMHIAAPWQPPDAALRT